MIDPNRIPTVDVLEAERRRGAALEAAEAGGGNATGGGTGGSTAGRTPLLVDVREPGEFTAVRAEGAVLFPLSTFMLRFRELPRDQPLLMICRTGARSGQATAFLLANGWPDVVNVAGGTVAWERAGLPVRRGALTVGEGAL